MEAVIRCANVIPPLREVVDPCHVIARRVLGTKLTCTSAECPLRGLSVACTAQSSTEPYVIAFRLGV